MDRNPSGDTPGGGSSGDGPGEFAQEVRVESLLPRSAGDATFRSILGESSAEVKDSKVTPVCDVDSR